MGWLNQKEINEVAEDLGVKPSDVIEMEKRMSNYDATLESRIENEEEPLNSPISFLKSNGPNPEELLEHEQNINHEQETLKNAISQLDERSKDIISSRWLVEKKATLHELAAIHNISAERVRQIENTAIKKLKKSIKN